MPYIDDSGDLLRCHYWTRLSGNCARPRLETGLAAKGKKPSQSGPLMHGGHEGGSSCVTGGGWHRPQQLCQGTPNTEPSLASGGPWKAAGPAVGTVRQPEDNTAAQRSAWQVVGTR